jgi:hypothetical protein
MDPNLTLGFGPETSRGKDKPIPGVQEMWQKVLRYLSQTVHKAISLYQQCGMKNFINHKVFIATF